MYKERIDNNDPVERSVVQSLEFTHINCTPRSSELSYKTCKATKQRIIKQIDSNAVKNTEDRQK